MDVAYNQHSSHARRSNRSTTNLNRLSLVPLTTKLPLSDHDDLPEALDASVAHSRSYLQGKSAPTTPALLTRSPVRSRSHSRRASTAVTPLPKSKSATHLARHSKHGSVSGAHSPHAHRHQSKDDHGALLSDRGRSDSDWLVRAGAALSGEYREYKGQAWLVSRDSSTSLTGVRDAEEEAFEREMAREREYASHHQSRRGSVMLAEDDLTSPFTVNGAGANNGSRFGSQLQSRAGSRTQMLTPMERRSIDGYFVTQEHHNHHGLDMYHLQQHEYHVVAGPDFVNLDEKLEAIEQDTTIEDEATVRRLVKREQGGGGGGFWLGNVLGWRLFSVEENEDESDDEPGQDDDDEDSDGDGDESGLGRSSSGSSSDSDSIEEMLQRKRQHSKQLEGITALPQERVPPPKADEGGWHDAAWLLSVASKVLL